MKPTGRPIRVNDFIFVAAVSAFLKVELVAIGIEGSLFDSNVLVAGYGFVAVGCACSTL